MFLTGQLHPKPWQEPQIKVVLKKDKHYYNNTQNLWNNPFRCCQKVSKYYHDPERIFKQTHYSDQEINQFSNQEKEYVQKYNTLMLRQQQMDRVQNRKFERELLQFKSNQPLKTQQIQQIEDAISLEPSLLEDISDMKSQNQQEVQQYKQPNMQLWNLISQFPAKQSKRILNNKIIQMDQNACDNIMK